MQTSERIKNFFKNTPPKMTSLCGNKWRGKYFFELGLRNASSQCIQVRESFQNRLRKSPFPVHSSEGVENFFWKRPRKCHFPVGTSEGVNIFSENTPQVALPTAYKWRDKKQLLHPNLENWITVRNRYERRRSTPRPKTSVPMRSIRRGDNRAGTGFGQNGKRTTKICFPFMAESERRINRWLQESHRNCPGE